MFERHRPDVMVFTAWQMLLGGLVMAPVAWLVPQIPAQWGWQLSLGMIYIVFIATAAGWLLWLQVVRRVPASIAGLSSLGVPVVAMLLAWALLSERPGGAELAGMALILAGIWVVSRAAPPGNEPPAALKASVAALLFSESASRTKVASMIDLRSDTVTRPTAAMLQAMMAAPVGDDVMGDDPSVNRLQAAVAERAGKEAGLFFPSGTQSNLAALMAHCERGDEYLVGQLAHTYRYEAAARRCWAASSPSPSSMPRMARCRSSGWQRPSSPGRSALRAHAPAGAGEHLPRQADSRRVHRGGQRLARGLGLGVHLDGARAFNAAVASGRPLAELCAPFDTVSLCFSKGLGAPVGSVLVGSRALIERALRWRKMLGGGLRQSGVLAAACLYALEHNVERLAQDHEHARLLAEGLRGIAGLRVLSQDTNMVFVEFEPSRCDALNAAWRRTAS